MYGHSIKKEKERNNVSGQKQRQQDREIISEKALEKRFSVSEKFKQVFWKTGHCSTKI